MTLFGRKTKPLYLFFFLALGCSSKEEHNIRANIKELVVCKNYRSYCLPAIELKFDIINDGLDTICIYTHIYDVCDCDLFDSSFFYVNKDTTLPISIYRISHQDSSYVYDIRKGKRMYQVPPGRKREFKGILCVKLNEFQTWSLQEIIDSNSYLINSASRLLIKINDSIYVKTTPNNKYKVGYKIRWNDDPYFNDTDILNLDFPLDIPH